MTSTSWAPQPLDADELQRRAATGVPRRRTSLTVAHPWGWLWWPGSMPPIAEDPDVTDQRSPREISELDVDWHLILHAVRHAVSQLPDDVDQLLRLHQVEVDVPFGLSVTEHKLALSWVGLHSPVTYWPEVADIREGRHRLWLSRLHYATCDVPLLDEHLVYLDDVRAGHISPHVTAASIAGELAWWAEQPDLLRRTSARHQEVLREIHLELAPGEPLPPDARSDVTQHRDDEAAADRDGGRDLWRAAREPAPRWLDRRRSP